MTTAVVVGSGPNGLAAAIRLAQAGVGVTVVEGSDRIGGGTRTSELTVPGVLHDDCAAFHPTGVASPFLASLGLERFGLEWLWHDIDLAHPLDDGRVGLLSRTMARTTDSLGEDGERWRRLFGRLSRDFDQLAAEVFQPVVHLPRHPLRLGHFGANALLPATVTVRRWRDDPARALYMGIAAHLFGRLDRPLSGAVGLLLGAAGHAAGWPVARGGSAAITAAMADLLTSLGGTVVTGIWVDDLDRVRDLTGVMPDVVLLDTSPRAAVRMLAERLPRRVHRALSRYVYGPAAHKVDYAIDGDIPWTNPDTLRGGTVHLGGTAEELVAVEAATVRGRMPERPFVLLGQQYRADPSRSAGSINPIYAYAHVPAGYDGDATTAVTRQIERFAPGFRDRIVASHVRGPAAMEAHNPNYVGGDIAVGANTALQLTMRPRIALNPYRTGIDGIYLCSSATPPGGGVHGMAGFHAAETALADL